MMVIVTIIQLANPGATISPSFTSTRSRQSVVAGNGFSSILNPKSSDQDDLPEFLPGAAVVNISGDWVIICMMALAIYSVLFYVFSYNIWHAVGAAGDAWGARIWQRRAMATLSMVQAALGFGVMLWILIGFFRLTRDRQADGLIIVIGQRTSMQLISIMQLLKAYHVNNRSKLILVIGTFLLLASLAMTGVKCSTIPPPSMRWGYYAVEMAAYLGMGVAIILELVLNLFVNVCFLVVVYRHKRKATSSLYSVLLRDGILFTMVCTISNILIATLFLTKSISNNILSIAYHISWALQSWLTIQQLESARRNRTATTSIHPATGTYRPSSSSSSRYTSATSPHNNSKYGEMTRYSHDAANREYPGVLAPATNVRYDSMHHSTSSKVNPQHASSTVDARYSSTCQSPIGTYLPYGAHGTATPQHHAKSPVKPSLRSPLFMTEAARKQRSVSFAGDDNQRSLMQRYSHSLLSERDGSSMEINTELRNSTSKRIAVDSRESTETNTARKRASPTSSLIICDAVDIDDAVNFTMTTEQTFSFHDHPASGSGTTVVSAGHSSSGNNNSSSTLNSIGSHQTSNASHLTSGILDEIAECYRTTPTGSKDRLSH
ncbi:hypothetical protein BDF22DRAFT_745378 [Syncephalis plumigaleata]|nr:hypothetical protein BDF22DRAFT_745378 [Syncephalis plumigaleata]